MVPLYFSVLLRFSPIEVMPSKDSIREYVLCFVKKENFLYVLSLIRLLGPSDRCFRSSLVFLFCFSTDNQSPFSQASRYIIFQIEKSQVALLFLKAILFDCCLVVQRYPLSSICGSQIEASHRCTCVNFFPALSLKISQS